MTAGLWMMQRRASERNAEHAFLAIASLLFALSATLTIVWSAPMAEMAGMPMPGGWTMSMAWMRMPEQTWAGVVASSLRMWIVMMVAMMMPSLVGMLLRYRDAVSSAAETRLGLLTALVGAAYFWVWTLVGMVVLPLGFALAHLEMQYSAIPRLVPMAAGVIVVIAGASQFTTWKAHHLACCRQSPQSDRTLPADTRTAWHYGVRLALHCSRSSAGLTAILLVMGVMDLRVMVAVTTAITAERLAPAGDRVARAIGIIVVCAGVVLLARAASLQ